MKKWIINNDGIIEPKDPSALQQVILDLANGVREPANDDEVELLAEIKEAEKMGYTLDLPFD